MYTQAATCSSNVLGTHGKLINLELDPSNLAATQRGIRRPNNLPHTVTLACNCDGKRSCGIAPAPSQAPSPSSGPGSALALWGSGDRIFLVRHGELQARPTGDQAARELLTLRPSALHRNQSHAADLGDGAVPRHCPSTSLCMCACVHGDPNLDWQQQQQQQQHSTPLPPPTDPLSLVTERHRHTLAQDGGQPLDPVGTMGSTAALQQLCSSAAPRWICVFDHRSDHLTSPHQTSSSTRPCVPPSCQAQRQPTRPQILPFSRLHSSAVLWPKAPLMLQPEEPEASLTSPSSCTSATTAMPPCPALPCLALPCALAPPGSSSAPGLNWTCLFWVGLALVDVSFLPACRGLAALLSAGSAVDSSEDTSPSLSHRWSS